MALEPLIIAAVMFLVLTPVVLVARRGRPRGTAIGATAVAAVLVGFVVWSIAARRPAALGELAITDRPIEIPAAGYVTSRTCRACHASAYDTWYATFHRTMTQVVTPQTVVGDFDNVEVEWQYRKYLFKRRGDEFYIEMDDPDRPGMVGLVGSGPRVERRIVLSTGSHHLQTYWYTTGRKRLLGQVPFYYSIQEKRWFPDHATFLQPPLDDGDYVPAEGTGNWHKTCIKCHTTNARPRFNFERNTDPDTHVSEMGISCEMCHGPGKEHVEANRDPVRRYGEHMEPDPDSTIVNPPDLDHRRASQVCGQCHSINGEPFAGYDRYAANGYQYRPGQDLNDTRSVCRGHYPLSDDFRDGAFWSDGMVRLGGREFIGLVESPCYQRGEMSCMSCHTLHKAEDDPRSLEEWRDGLVTVGMRGKQGCLQCHDSIADDIEEHTHHAPESSGSLCYDCHMTRTSYGLHKAIRSHQVDSPSVDVSVKTGRPNACNQCHLDQTLAWTAGYLRDWYDIETAPLTSDQSTVAASVLWALTGDAGQRALMAWSMGWKPAQEASGTDWLGRYLAQLMLDPYDAVRFIAFRSLRDLDGFVGLDFDFVGPPEVRSAVAHRAIAIWESRHRESDAPRENVLIDASGRLDGESFKRLFSRRNDRPFRLNE